MLGLCCTAAAFVFYGALVAEAGPGRALVITYVAAMGTFMVELYVACGAETALEAAVALTCGAAERLTRRNAGAPLRAIFVPEDETCFLLSEADDAAAAQATARAAGLPFERPATAVAEL